MRTAVVLSGGGARGAYEAGVLYYVLEKLPGFLRRPVRFDIMSGTSVGAIHACYLAAFAGEPWSPTASSRFAPRFSPAEGVGGIETGRCACRRPTLAVS